VLSVDAVVGGVSEASEALLILRKLRWGTGACDALAPKSKKLSVADAVLVWPGEIDFELFRWSSANVDPGDNVGKNAVLRDESSEASRVGAVEGRLYDRSGGTAGKREEIVLIASSSSVSGLGIRPRNPD